VGERYGEDINLPQKPGFVPKKHPNKLVNFPKQFSYNEKEKLKTTNPIHKVILNILPKIVVST